MRGSGEKAESLASHSEKELGLFSCGTFFRSGNGNTIRPVGVLADKDRLECVDGLRLNPSSKWGSKSDTVELILGLLLNVELFLPPPLLLLFLYLMAAMAHTSKASALSLSGVLALVST